jgi:hypothetical protein
MLLGLISSCNAHTIISYNVAGWTSKNVAYMTSALSSTSRLTVSWPRHGNQTENQKQAAECPS